MGFLGKLALAGLMSMMIEGVLISVLVVMITRWLDKHDKE